MPSKKSSNPSKRSRRSTKSQTELEDEALDIIQGTSAPPENSEQPVKRRRSSSDDDDAPRRTKRSASKKSHLRRPNHRDLKMTHREDVQKVVNVDLLAVKNLPNVNHGGIQPPSSFGLRLQQ